MERIVKMALEEKSYKSVYRYREVVEPHEAPVINYLYIKKYAFDKVTPPAEIIITIN